MAASCRLAVLLALTIALPLVAAQVPPPPPPQSPPPAVPSAPPPPAPSTGNGSSCDTLKLRVCASLLNGLLGVLLPPGGGNAANNDSQCCPLLAGLVDLDAAVCLCTAIRANVLGVINFDVPLGLRLVLNHCDKAVPDGFTCVPA